MYIYICIIYGHFNQDSCDMMYDHSHGVVWITCRDRTWQTKLDDWFLKFEGMPSILWPQLSKTVSSSEHLTVSFRIEYTLTLKVSIKIWNDQYFDGQLISENCSACSCVCLYWNSHIYYIYIWLVVWNIFPYFGNNHPKWLSYFSEG